MEITWKYGKGMRGWGAKGRGEHRDCFRLCIVANRRASLTLDKSRKCGGRNQIDVLSHPIILLYEERRINVN